MVKKAFIAFTLIIILLFLIFATRICLNYDIACENYSNNTIKTDITLKANEKISDYLKENEKVLSELIEISYNTKHEIDLIKIDSARLNKAVLDIEKQIMYVIKNNTESYGIPLGNITGFSLLSGKGPEIMMKILSTGNTDYVIESEIISSGINQSLYRVSVCYDSEIKCIVPFHEISSIICFEIVLCELIIVGTVPEIILSTTK